MATVEGKDKGRLSDDEDKREERERQRGIADNDEVDLRGVKFVTERVGEKKKKNNEKKKRMKICERREGEKEIALDGRGRAVLLD